MAFPAGYEKAILSDLQGLECPSILKEVLLIELRIRSPDGVSAESGKPTFSGSKWLGG